MKTISRVTYQSITVLLAGIAVSATAAFNSGSTGANGTLEVTTNTTLQLPPDGVFHYTTITIASNATLTFTPNALNTPAYLLAQGDVVINGTIDVSGYGPEGYKGGRGGPGGFAGGNGAYLGQPAGDGQGPGAGRAGQSTWGNSDGPGSAAYGAPASSCNGSTNLGNPYGSPLLSPLIGGSGGGGRPDVGGAGGGGALLIASSSRINLSGVLTSTSHQAYSAAEFGHGSGGAIRLVAPIIIGNGALDVSGGKDTWWPHECTRAGSGRLRIDCMDRRSLAVTVNPAPAMSLGANMLVFPMNAPRLNITQAAGTTIPIEAGTRVEITLPEGSSTNQTVTVQARNFGGSVPFRIAVTPEYGPGSFVDTNIDNTISPATLTVPVSISPNVPVHISAWTR